MISEKKTHRVGFFMGDQEYEALLHDAYDARREPADFLRYLWLEHRANKIREWASACQRKELELAGSGNEWADTVTQHRPHE